MTLFSLFKKQPSASLSALELLDETERLAIRAIAEELDCSATPDLILSSRQAGSLPTRALGSGIDYAESRVYQPGDDPRSINWRLSARSHETFVKTYHVESRPSLCILLDRRQNMVFGTRKRLKITQAVRAAYLLAYAGEFHHLSFQAWIIDENGAQHFDESETFLAEANKPCAYPSHNQHPTLANTKAKPFSVLKDMIQYCASGSLIYLISDFAGIDNAANQSALAQLSEQNFLQAIHVVDKAELSLPNIGKLRLKGLQGLQNNQQDQIYKLNTHKDKERTAFTALSKTIIDNRKATITDLGISYCQLSTEDEAIQNEISLPLGQA